MQYKDDNDNVVWCLKNGCDMLPAAGFNVHGITGRHAQIWMLLALLRAEQEVYDKVLDGGDGGEDDVPHSAPQQARAANDLEDAPARKGKGRAPRTATARDDSDDEDEDEKEDSEEEILDLVMLVERRAYNRDQSYEVFQVLEREQDDNFPRR